MKTLKTFIFILFLTSLCISCSDTDIPTNSNNKKGTLIAPSLSFDVDIETDNFSKKQKTKEKLQSRTTGNDVNNFVVEILSSPDGNIVKSYENYSELIALGKVELEAGNYTLKVYNDDFPSSSPSFDFPYFLGESEVFSIEFEETTEIDDLVIKAENSKVTVNYSDNIVQQFEGYQVEITTSENDKNLLFSKLETRSGFFSASYDLSILGKFNYTKTDGTTETKTIRHEIKNIKAGVAYKININVVLENGELVFKLILDDSFEEETIDLGNGAIVDDHNNKYIPKELPVITSPLNTFEKNSTTTYNLTWESIEDATYTVFTGTNIGNLSEIASNISTNSKIINLIEGRNFFKLQAHFSDGESTEYLGGNFRKYPEIGTVNSLVELSPINEETYNEFQTNIIDGENVLFQANDNTSSTESVRLHINGSTSGDIIDLTSGGINEYKNYGDGGMSYYYYSSKQDGFFARNNDNYQYFTAIINPQNSPSLSQYSSPALSVEITLSNFSWHIGTPYFYIEKREQGTTAWKNVNNGWHTSTSVFDYDLEKGKTYEYRFKMNNTKDFVGASEYSPVGAIMVQ